MKLVGFEGGQKVFIWQNRILAISCESFQNCWSLKSQSLGTTRLSLVKLLLPVHCPPDGSCTSPGKSPISLKVLFLLPVKLACVALMEFLMFSVLSFKPVLGAKNCQLGGRFLLQPLSY